MSGQRSMTSWVRRVLGRASLEAEMREEMEFHFAARMADLMSGGLSESEARRRARIEYGGADHYREECRSALGYRPLDELGADIRYAARGIRKSPVFAAAAIAMLALAIGANSVLFTLYSNYVMKPLPIRGAARHFDLAERNSQARGTGGWTATELRALRQSAASRIEGLYTAGTIQVLLLAPVQRQVFVTVASGNYFGLLGGVARVGRTFVESEERQPLAVLSDAGWRKLMASDPSAVGKSLRVRSVVYTVAGLMGPEFTGTEAVVPDFWVPSGMREALRDRPQTSGTGGEHRDNASAILRPGVSRGEAQAVLTAVAARFERAPEDRVAVVELRGHHSFIPDDDNISAAMAMVFGAFLVVLSIACANLANLYLSRAASRTHEIAMRLSLGASRWRIVRQLLTESTLIALIGAAAGLALAAIGIRQVRDYLLSTVMGAGLSVLPVSLDWRVFLYTATLGMMAGLAFGLLPALEATSPGLAASAKREFSSFAGRMRPRVMRNLLIGGQVAASLVLLILAGVLTRNIQRLDSVAPGFDLDRVLDVKVDRLSRALLDRLARLEPVRGVTAVNRVPLMGRLERHPAVVDGAATSISFNHVDERYFEVLGVPVEQGRGFLRHEAESRAKVTVISAATARKFWPAVGAMSTVIGRTIELPPERGEDPGTAGIYQVIGVAPDLVSGWFFEGKDATAMYLPAAAGSEVVDSAMVHVVGNVAAARMAIRKACADLREAPAGCDPASLREVAAMQRFPFQAAAAVAGVLGTLALLLTGIGLYGVVNYSVAQRRREIGVHVALGATPRQVMGRILREAWWCVAGGLALGLPVCLALSKLAASSVFQIQTFDAGSYAVVPLLLTGISMLACFGPAWRAARTDPMRSLREE